MAVIEITSRFKIINGCLWKGDKPVTEPEKLNSLDFEGTCRGLDRSLIERYALRGTKIVLRRIFPVDGPAYWDTGSASIPEVEKAFKELERDKKISRIAARLAYRDIVGQTEGSK